MPFSLWQANVKLVCLLELAHLPVDKNKQPLTFQNGFIEKNRDNNTAGAWEMRYFIRGQQDHYQTNDMLKFIAPFGASALLYLWQLLATVLCAAGTTFLWLVTSIYERNSIPPAKENWRATARRPWYPTRRDLFLANQQNRFRNPQEKRQATNNIILTV